MLTKKKKDFYRQLLSGQLEKLMEEVAGSLDGFSEIAESSPDFTDRATLESFIDLSMHMKERHRNLIFKIRDALDRVEDGTYGICSDCGEKISPKRLEARPVASLCINCKRRQETDERLRGL